MTRGRTAAVVLRTVIGWTFFTRATSSSPCRPGRGRAPRCPHGAPRGIARGSLASAFHALAGSPPAGWTDLLVPIALVLVGVSLTLGLFTQAGCSARLGLLTLFYLAMIPVTGVPMPNGEGA
jgi:uncharacterized membrane protein YphA (DoxX/SURF4 family)